MDKKEVDMNQLNCVDYDIRFLDLAKMYSRFSKDPSTKVGAVITDKHKCVISIACNGFPRGIEDSDYRLNDRKVKLKYMVHAEMNALLKANSLTAGGTLYVYPMLPCATCALNIVSAGIATVVAPVMTNKLSRWSEDISFTKQIFDESGVIYKEIIQSSPNQPD